MKVIATALLVGGIVILTTHIWVGSSHFALNGYNWVNDFRMFLNISGWGMIFLGSILLVIPFKMKRKESKEPVFVADRPAELKQNR